MSLPWKRASAFSKFMSSPVPGQEVKMRSTPSDVPAALLVGGKGTRLSSVLPSTPKPLASIGDTSFLDLLVRQLHRQHVRRLVMCTGYRAGQIEEVFRDGGTHGVTIEYSKELVPMGTGGALKLAQPRLSQASEFLVMNGDSFLQTDFSKLVQFHRAHEGIASIAVVRVQDASRYGTVQINAEGRVTGFLEKSGASDPGLINAGVYVFDQAIFDYFPDGESSLEKDVFPQILECGVYALEHSGMFIDIGIPEDYARAQVLREELLEAACRK